MAPKAGEGGLVTVELKGDLGALCQWWGAYWMTSSGDVKLASACIRRGMRWCPNRPIRTLSYARSNVNYRAMGSKVWMMVLRLKWLRFWVKWLAHHLDGGGARSVNGGGDLRTPLCKPGAGGAANASWCALCNAR
eukprot:2831915-Amphidinium_carterae.1